MLKNSADVDVSDMKSWLRAEINVSSFTRAGRMLASSDACILIFCQRILLLFTNIRCEILAERPWFMTQGHFGKETVV
jgi:hypothetical protein